VHGLRKETGTGEVLCELRPLARAVAGLFLELATTGGDEFFAGLDAAGGKLKQELVGGVTPLADEQDAGSAGLVRVSTARMTTEPLWRMTSRVARTPPGSVTSSRVTQKTRPWKTVLLRRVRPRPESLRGPGFARPAVGDFFLAAFLEGICF